MLPQLYRHAWMDGEIEAFREQVRRYISAEFAPRLDEWRRQGYIPREVWRPFGEISFLLPEIPESYGGAGASLAYQLVVQDELAKAEMPVNIAVHTIASHYILDFGTEAQKQRWLPKVTNGEMLAAIAMTEPGCGSDLKAISTRARRDGDHYVIDGAKTFITNGFTGNLLIVAARTSGTGSKGVSLFVLETENLPGFRVGRLLEKIGMQASDTAELFFDSVRVPADQLLGEVEGQGFGQLMGALRSLLPCRRPPLSSRRWPSRLSTRSSARPSARPSSTCSSRARNWPRWPLPRMWCAASSTTAPSACWTARWITRPLTWQSGGAPSSSAAWWTSAFNCSAATATWPSTRSRGCMPLRECRRSMAAPTRS